MIASVFVKLAEQPISSPPSSLNPIKVEPATGGAGSIKAPTSLIGGALNTAGNAIGRVQRGASGIANTAAAGAGKLLGGPASAAANTANYLAPNSMKKYTSPWVASTDDFYNSMLKAESAGLKDIGSAFSRTPSPSASQANMAENVKWLQDAGQPVNAALTKTLYGVGNGAAEAVPGSAALGGVGGVLAKTAPVAAPGASLASKATTLARNPLTTARNVGAWAAGQGANAYAAEAYGEPAMTAAQYGVDAMGLGGVSDMTSKAYGQLAKTPFLGPAAQVGAAVAPSLVPAAARPFARALQIGSVTPFAVQPEQRIDTATGEINPTHATPADATQPAATVEEPFIPPSPSPTPAPIDPSPPADATQPENMPPADATQPANPAPPTSPPSNFDIGKIFSQLAEQWGKLDPRLQAAIIAGGGLGLGGLMGGGTGSLLGLGLAGVGAHQGLFGSDAQHLMQGFGQTVSDALFKKAPVTNKPGGAGSKSTVTPSTTVSPQVRQMRDAAAQGDHAAAKQLEAYEAANPHIGGELKKLDSGMGQYDWAAANYLQSDPAWKGITTQDITDLRRVRNYGKAKGMRISYNIPAANLDAVDTIRNNVNVNGNFPSNSAFA